MGGKPNRKGIQRVLKSRPHKVMFRLVLGDSFAEGMAYATVRRSLPPQMRGYKVRFANGELSSKTLRKVKRIKVAKGSTVMIFTGANDLIRIGRGIASNPSKIQERLRNNVLKLISWAKNKDIRLVLATVPPCRNYRSIRNAKAKVPVATLNAMDSYNQWLLSQRSKNVIVLDLDIFRDKNARYPSMLKRYTYDGLHPTGEGFVMIAKMFRLQVTSKHKRKSAPRALLVTP